MLVVEDKYVDFKEIPLDLESGLCPDTLAKVDQGKSLPDLLILDS